MNKLIVGLCSIALLVGCETIPLENVNIKEYGKKEIAPGFFLKRIYVDDYNDVVYYIVDSNNIPIQGASTNYQIGKVRKKVSSVIISEVNTKMDTAVVDDVNIDSAVQKYKERLIDLQKYNELKKKLNIK